MTTLGALMGFLLFSGNAVPAHAIEHIAQAATPVIPSYSVALTAYNAVPEQTDENPFETASGMFSNPEIVAARSRNLADDLPFGTIIAFDGSRTPLDDSCGYEVVASRIGYRVIADTMSARFTDRIDILFAEDENYTNTDGSVVNAATVLGVCKNIDIRVVGRIDMRRPPHTQSELAAIVKGSSLVVK